jgi:hypothetical protein
MCRFDTFGLRSSDFVLKSPAEPNLVAQHFVSREFSFIKVKLAQHMMCDAPMAPGI